MTRIIAARDSTPPIPPDIIDQWKISICRLYEKKGERDPHEMIIRICEQAKDATRTRQAIAEEVRKEIADTLRQLSRSLEASE